jgi:hypothetical protein
MRAAAALITRLYPPVVRERWGAEISYEVAESATVRTLTAPVLALAAMVVTARSGMAEHPTGFPHAALIVYYWATLGFIAVRLCTLIARAATMSTTRRLCAALLLIGTGLALAAVQSLLAAVRTPVSLTATLVLGLLAAATISAGHDLRGGSPR